MTNEQEPRALAEPTDADVEAVARAIWGEWSLWSAPITKPKPSWPELADGNKDIGRRLARAAIAAWNRRAPVADQNVTEDARVAARAWLEAYGIRTEPYTRGGGDHPAMTTLPDAFTAFAHHRAAAGFARGVEAAVGALQRIGHPDNEAPSFVNGYSAALRSSVGAIRALIPATETPGGGGVAPEVVALNVARRALAPFAQLADVLTIIDAKNRNRECLLTISDPQRSRDIRALAIFDARDAIRQIDAVLALAPKTPE